MSVQDWSMPEGFLLGLKAPDTIAPSTQASSDAQGASSSGSRVQTSRLVPSKAPPSAPPDASLMGSFLSVAVPWEARLMPWNNSRHPRRILLGAAEHSCISSLQRELLRTFPQPNPRGLRLKPRALLGVPHKTWTGPFVKRLRWLFIV